MVNARKEMPEIQILMTVIHNPNHFCFIRIQQLTRNGSDVNNFRCQPAQNPFTWQNDILFSLFCTNHMENAGSGTSPIGLLATISRPCINIRYWSVVISNASSLVCGQRKFPFSILLYNRRKPSFSYPNIRIRKRL